MMDTELEKDDACTCCPYFLDGYCHNCTHEDCEKENKTVSRKANEAIADKLLITAKYNEVLNDLNQENSKLEKENAELNCECRRCVYTDCPCVLSDYGKDRNGICDHFKDVFDENAELKTSCKIQVDTAFQTIYEKDDQLTKAKEIIKKLLHSLKNEDSDYTFALESTHPVLAEAEQFLREVEK